MRRLCWINPPSMARAVNPIMAMRLMATRMATVPRRLCVVIFMIRLLIRHGHLGGTAQGDATQERLRHPLVGQSDLDLVGDRLHFAADRDGMRGGIRRVIRDRVTELAEVE